MIFICFVQIDANEKNLKTNDRKYVVDNTVVIFVYWDVMCRIRMFEMVSTKIPSQSILTYPVNNAVTFVITLMLKTKQTWWR